MIVSLTACARPRYLAEVLDSLDAAAANLPEPVMLCASVEPGCREIEEMLNARGRGTWVHVNDEVKGCSGNTLLALVRGFELAARMGEDHVFHLEEDFVLAPDALSLAAWARDEYRHDDSVVCTGASTAHAATSDEYLQVHKSDWFHCQGWGTWADRWERTLLPRWRHRPGDVELAGWAQNFNDRAFLAPEHPEASANGKLYQVIPRLSRVRHIGLEGGVHTTPETFARDLPKVFAGDVRVPCGRYVALPGAESR